MTRKKPVVLLILDGWGESNDPNHNAIASAHTPVFDKIYQTYLHTLISGCGEDVGLPDGQMGNSEVGHLTLGSGRVIFQDLGRINHALKTRDFYKNPAILSAIQTAKASNKSLHVFCLLSPGGVHSHQDHLFALLDLVREQECKNLCVHAFLDGRDTPPQSAMPWVQELEQRVANVPGARIATIGGRYYGMDRDKRWERVKLAYDAIVHGQAPYYATSAQAALRAAYEREEADEFVMPTCIVPVGSQAIKMHDGDCGLYMNFRSDRARALSYAFTQTQFAGFDRGKIPILAKFVTLTEYDDKLAADVAFPAQQHSQVLGEYLQNLGLTQLHIAETEKYAHVTFFFNGGVETPFVGEERILVPSPKIATYDLQPQMSAPLLTELLVENILQNKFDFIVCNYANADMVGHTGNLAATITAIETLDTCVGQIMQALEKVDGEMLITADHGNAECMVDPDTHQPHTAHTTSLVPFIYIGKQHFKIQAQGGKLSDVAPTILTLMNLAKPKEMTGNSLLYKE